MSVMRCVLPTLRPAGGVVKVLDYVTHARAAGWSVLVATTDQATPDLPVFTTDRFVGLLEDPEVGFTTNFDALRLGPGDIALLSLPSQYPLVHAGLRAGQSPERIIHLVQGVRHATPKWMDGYSTRLLARPMARIMTNDVIHEKVAPYLHPRSLAVTIPLGHPTGFFSHRDRGPMHDTIRVGFTTWKSQVGDTVAHELEGEGFTFRAIREHVGWDRLRELYQWCDVFLGTPGPQEGFYMPAFEAMEAGALVVVPDAGGNMAYCEFGVNCLHAGHEQPVDYVEALRKVRTMDHHQIVSMRQAADRARKPFDLATERSAFIDLLGRLQLRLEESERTGRPPVGE